MRHLALSLLERPSGIYVFQRRDMQAPTSPGMLALFGGHMEPEEITRRNGEGAMRRELGEEIGISSDDLAPVFIVEHVVPAACSSSGELTAVNLFTTFVGKRQFEVYEGAGAEDYTLEDVLARDDLATTVRFMLEHMPPQA